MNLKLLIIHILVQVVIRSSDIYAEGILLTPSSVDVWEDSDVTLFCTDHGRNLEAVGWEKNDIRVAMHRDETICKAYGFLTDRTLYSYSCNNQTTFSVTVKKITGNQNGDKWKCLDIFSKQSNNVTIFVKVPPQAVAISPEQNVFTTAENETFPSLSCISNKCRPEPIFMWYTDRNTDSREDDILLWQDKFHSVSNSIIQSYTSTFDFTANRTLNGWYIFCVAKNDSTDFAISDKIFLNITYAPDSPPRITELDDEQEHRVIEGNCVTLTCSVTGGNPLPKLEWSRSNNVSQTIKDITVTTRISWQAFRSDQGDVVCTYNHLHKNETTSIRLIVLFPPDSPTITINSMSVELLNVRSAIDIIEHDSFEINCSAVSNPPVLMFEWNGLLYNNSFSSNKSSLNRSQTTVVCTVFNHMKASKSDEFVTGANSRSLNVNVLYPPKVNTKIGKNIAITEGSDFIYSCNVTHGNPNITKVAWRWEDQTSEGQQLTLSNVSRNQTGVYQCCAGNKMISYDGTLVEGIDCENTQLNIEYRAQVLNLRVFANNLNTTDSLIVSENDACNVTCEIEGNPFPKADLKLQVTNYIPYKQVEVKSFNTLTRLYLITELYAKCTDAGQYTCTGWNTLHNGLKTVSSRILNLFVKCKPRKSPFHEIPHMVYSTMSRDVTLSFTTLAYPVPPESGYVWYKKSFDGNWTAINISSADDKIIITSSGLQSNLSIKNITHSDYGVYKVMVENDIGNFTYTFNLTDADADSSEDSKLLIATVSGAVGGVLLILVSFVAITLIRKSSQRWNSYSVRDSRNPEDSHVNQNSEGVAANSPLDRENTHLYEELQNAASVNYTTLDGANPNMYEDLQNAETMVRNSDRSSYFALESIKPNIYEEIQNKGELKEYENLKLTRLQEALQDR